MKLSSHLGLAFMALASCGPQRSPQQPMRNSEAPVLLAPTAPPAVKNSASPVPQPPPTNETSRAEPEGPIDPRSIGAAGQVVEHYGALIEQKRFAEAARLWGDPQAAANFEKQIGHRHIHLEIGALGEAQGAAGSVYTSVPVTFHGEGFRRAANIILRRVNEVPGSSEAQRRWHIERIEWDKND